MDLTSELERRYANTRAAMAAHDLDALIVSGSEYSGFEGGVTYLSGFQIVHRYAYVIVPADGDPFIVFPTEARYVGEHGTTRLEQVFADRPGAEIAARAQAAGWKRVGVFGLDYIMNVRDHSALSGLDLVHFDMEFDHSRAVKSKAELESVRDSVRINQRGFEVFFDAYEPGRSAAEVMGAAEGYFVSEGCGRLTMNMVLTAPGRSGLATPEFKIARKEEILGDFLLPSLEVAGPGMHWVEISRAVGTKDAPLSDHTKRQMEAYTEYYEAAKTALRAGATCHDVHRAVSAGFSSRGYQLGHVTGHSIGMTMIEFPKIGEGVETELAEDMVFSMHPHAIADSGDCLYMQDTWLVTAGGGEPLAATLPMQLFLK
jgi:Xaa-Pro aminopeptidase